MRQDTELHINSEFQARLKQGAKKVVIVDDSASMRRWLRLVLNNDTRLHVVGEASDAETARRVIKETEPDVLTLDIEMPGMNGLDFLDRLMRLRPMPVVMVSSAARQGSRAAVQALSLGAVDCLLKPARVDDFALRRGLGRRVFSAACSRVTARQAVPAHVARPDQMNMADGMPIILMGASTGGVAALETVLHGLHPQGPPVVIVQHMPGTFLVSFAQMLDRRLPQSVGLLRDGDRLKAGQVMLAPSIGEQHAEVARDGGTWVTALGPAAQKGLHYPSVDALFNSATAQAHDVFAVLLTGMGRDGAAGLVRLRAAGARTIAQDAATSVAFGMPRVAQELGGVEQQLPLDQIAAALNDLCRQHTSTKSAPNL